MNFEARLIKGLSATAEERQQYTCLRRRAYTTVEELIISDAFKTELVATGKIDIRVGLDLSSGVSKGE